MVGVRLDTFDRAAVAPSPGLRRVPLPPRRRSGLLALAVRSDVPARRRLAACLSGVCRLSALPFVAAEPPAIPPATPTAAATQATASVVPICLLVMANLLWMDSEFEMDHRAAT